MVFDRGKPSLLPPRKVVGRLILLFAGMIALGCGQQGEIGSILPDANVDAPPPDAELVARFVQLTDAQVVDEESPGRLTSLAELSIEAWRPHLAYSPHFLDGVIRAINRRHVASGTIDFVVHTGDAVDNAQMNELEWFVGIFDGMFINPLTGPDDRDPAELPASDRDPHREFKAQGLYRQGVHGGEPSIPWYSLLGNHDRFAVGVFPIYPLPGGDRYAPLPLDLRIGFFLPTALHPTGSRAWAPLTPANPGPPPTLNTPEQVVPNPERRYFSAAEFIEAHAASVTEPRGHGFDDSRPDQTWYSVSPLPGLRLIGLNSSEPVLPQPRLNYSDGSVSLKQAQFLRSELERAQAAQEWVIVMTHHPSGLFEPVYGSALEGSSIRTMLNEFSCVKLHLAGHTHSSLVVDRGGYIEMITGAILDPPHEGRQIELWRADGEAFVRYEPVSHLDKSVPPDASSVELFEDPYRELRLDGEAISATYLER
jgi:3',5'-cyclic AMP phosphodiesterase CpdA